MERRSYDVDLTINTKKITKVVIDPHYEEKHESSINDGIILKLVKKLDGKEFLPVDTDDTFEYYVEDKIKLDDKLYKLVWLLEEDQIYIGVLNAYRRD